MQKADRAIHLHFEVQCTLMNAGQSTNKGQEICISMHMTQGHTWFNGNLLFQWFIYNDNKNPAPLFSALLIH